MRAYVNNWEAELLNCKCAQICQGFHRSSQPPDLMLSSPHSADWITSSWTGWNSWPEDHSLLSELQEGSCFVKLNSEFKGTSPLEKKTKKELETRGYNSAMNHLVTVNSGWWAHGFITPFFPYILVWLNIFLIKVFSDNLSPTSLPQLTEGNKNRSIEMEDKFLSKLIVCVKLTRPLC